MATSSIIIVPGTVEDLLLTVTSCADNSRVDLTGLPIELEIASNKGGVIRPPVITKTEADFVLRDQLDAATKGQADLKLSAVDTAKLTPGTAIVTVYVTESGDRRRVLRQQITVEA
jgi:hypothetical protein